MPTRPLPFVLAGLAVMISPIACERGGASSVPTSALSDSGSFVVIEAAPAHLRGRVALATGARLYAAPRFSSSSWTLVLPEPPLSASRDALARARALRVVGISGDFLALTNDLADDSGLGCGQPLAGTGHLRMLFYVPMAHLAPVLTRALELEPLGDAGLLRVSAGARVGEPIAEGGMPSPGADSHWRPIDADGLRALVPVPDDAVGLAWDPAAQIDLESEGQLLFRDAEGSFAWLSDPGGDELGLTLRNACAEHLQTIADPSEVASLRELARESTDDPISPQDFIREQDQAPQGPYRLVVGSDLRWTDGNLAAEVLMPFEIGGLGQDWEDRRCFSLELGDELQIVEGQPPVACVKPDQLDFVDDFEGDPSARFERGLELEIGGSVRFSQPTVEGPWGAEVVRELLNLRHATIAECLRPFAERLDASGLPVAGRWRLDLEVDSRGRVVDASVDPIATSDERTDDCLRADTGTWLLPPSAGKLMVELEFGDEQALAEAMDRVLDAAAAEAEANEAASKSKPKPKSKPKSKSKESGSVMIIRDEGEDDPALEDLPPRADPPPQE